MDVLLLREPTSPTTIASVFVRLDKDIVAQGPSDIVALERFVHTLDAQAAWDQHDGREPFSAIEPPPDVYARLYAKSTPWAGQAPDGMRIRVWEGMSPAIAERRGLPPPA